MMNDYISRKEAITQAHEIIKGYAGYKAWAIVDMLRKLPSADVVEVIRCRNCKWWRKATKSAQGRCSLLGIYPTGGWYCANAMERGAGK